MIDTSRGAVAMYVMSVVLYRGPCAHGSRMLGEAFKVPVTTHNRGHMLILIAMMLREVLTFYSALCVYLVKLIEDTVNSRYASGPKYVQTLQIQEVHPVPHSNATFQCMELLPFIYYVFYLAGFGACTLCAQLHLIKFSFIFDAVDGIFTCRSMHKL